MTTTIFETFPDTTRLWIYAFERDLTTADLTRVRTMLQDFVDSWNSHGAKVTGGCVLLDQRFVLLATVPESVVSGCSIDSSTRVLKGISTELGNSCMKHFNMLYRDADGAVCSVDRPTFQRLVREGSIGPETRVFNNAITTLAELRGGQWEMALKDSPFALAFTTA